MPWRTAAILKIVKSPYLSEKSSIRLWWNLVRCIRYWTRWQSHDQNLKVLKNSIWRMAAMLKIAFLAINHQPIVQFQRNFVRESTMACWQKPHDKNCNFENRRWRTDAILKIVKLPYLSEQEAHLSQWDRATLRVIKYCESLKITQDHSKWHCCVGHV